MLLLWQFLSEEADILTRWSQNICKSYERILIKFCRDVGCGPGRNRLDFGGDLDSVMDPGLLFRILYHSTKCVVPNYLLCNFCFFMLFIYILFISITTLW